MQADFLLFMRDLIAGAGHYSWWPETLLYAERHAGVFEIFARSRSTAYFQRVMPILGIEKKEEIDMAIKKVSEDRHNLPSWGFDRLSPAALLNYEQLGTAR